MFRGAVKARRRGSSPPPEKRRRRPISVYDCVAGRVNANGFIPEKAHISSGRMTSSSSRVPVPPDEYLFKQRDAPPRYEEDDIYFADRHLAPHQQLPDSDLLKALHAHSSEVYAQAYGRHAKTLYKSLDETALLTLGILMEEAAADIFDEVGNMKLEKPEENGHVNVENDSSRPDSGGKRKRDQTSGSEDEESDNGAYHDVRRHWLQDEKQD
ncbi:hypothetical protein DBV05_g11027 [Lasiodiplodia theobromae]|nr:hypothetical protein DBV05_g11027 [Lasiodiplodia theobromae]